jgi:acetyltransferase-like isoleucine patch superfamily enzyme
MKENDDPHFKKWKMPEIGEKKLHPKYFFLVQHKENLELGYKTDIGEFTYINAEYGVKIEKNVQIGSHCSIYSHSTIDDKKGKIIIKENARIGTHSTIMPGITIGHNAIIGAYTFVNKNIPDNAVAYGIPVKIRKRDK